MPSRNRDWLRVVRTGRWLGAGFAALSFFIAAATIFYVQQQSNDAVLRRALEIQIAFADVFSGLQDAEVGQRGYLLTGDGAFLQPYRAARERLATQIGKLGNLVSHDRDLDGAYAALKSLADAKQTELAQSIALYQSDQADAALSLVRNGDGKQIMDKIRVAIAEMDAREDRVVEAHQAQLRLIGLSVAVSIVAAVVLLGLVTRAALREARRRSQLSRFLPAEVADGLAAGDQSLRTGREMPAAIAFVDIRGSTALAERIAVADLSGLLSRFRRNVLTAAESNGGLVDKFIGDGALVVFGVQDPEARAAAQAIRFARELRELHRASQAQAEPVPYEIAIGIHYGTVFCGIVGTDTRLEFTVLGDPVNVAARLEKETRVYGVDLLVSGAVLEAARDMAGDWRELAIADLRGHNAAVPVFTDRPAPAG